MGQITIKNPNTGGLADSDYLGAENSWAEAVGLDIHSEAGLIKVNQKLTEDSGGLVDDLVKAIVPSSDGSTYFFGSTNGKVWKRTSGGTWSLEATAAPAAGSAGITGAEEYQGYIYYGMESRLGRWQLGTAWSTRNDSWATFGVTDADFHPMRKVNLVLYIGDGNQVAQVDGTTFSANALDIKTPLRIKSLGKMDTDLLVGTFVNDNVNETEIIRWNTWSVSFSVSDEIPEVGVNCFIEGDNITIVSAGVKGNLYLYDGAKLELWKNIKGTWNSTNKAVVHPNASDNFHGMPLFGLSASTGTPTNLGVYSIHRTNRNYPYVLNQEHAISSDNLNNIEIGAVRAVGDVFFVSWKDTNGGTTYGVDKLDLSNKYANAYFKTRVMMVDREMLSNYGVISVPYKSKPASTDIDIFKYVNHGSEEEITNTTDDTDRNMMHTEVDVGEASTLQVKVGLGVNENDAPELEMAIIKVDEHE